jgi:16S rRNA (uracil1498-N3)-methyltransferase
VEAFDDLGAALHAAAADGVAGFVLQPDAASSLGAAARAESGSGAGAGFALAVGPEGGFEDDELALAERSGYRAVRLGRRVLRTETAGVVAAAVLQAVAGDYR